MGHVPVGHVPVGHVPGTVTVLRRLSILGSTGSIGRSALDVVRHYPDRFEVVALTARSNVELLAAQIAEFRPAHVAVGHEAPAERLVEMDLGVTVWTGRSGLERVASMPVDVTLCAMVGSAGLRPLLSAIEAGNQIALANKESLVMAGGLVMKAARAHNVDVLPVDSEHSAVFQCLTGHDIDDVHRVHLTASGGPFYGRRREDLRRVTPHEATQHPTWDMGAKISVDSATLMNKGLEVIEAMWLFGLPLSKVEVVIHPQSIVHSLVEFNDGSILAHLGVTDMKFPILFALTWPQRVEYPMDRLDLTTMPGLTFAAPDFSQFPCLALALEAADTAGTAPAILNAANEAAVAAFCEGRLGFLDIEAVVRQVLEACPVKKVDGLEAVEAADVAAREEADAVIERLSD